MGSVDARQKAQKDGTYRITCGAVLRKGELCPFHLGTAIRAADHVNTPVDVPEDKAFLGGNYYAGDGFAYRLDADTQFYLVESVKPGVPKPGKIEHRRGRTKHRPRRPMATSIANTMLSGLDAYEPHHSVVVPKIIGAFPNLARVRGVPRMWCNQRSESLAPLF